VLHLVMLFFMLRFVLNTMYASVDWVNSLLHCICMSDAASQLNLCSCNKVTRAR
jgi:hypothetical protein